jgi:tetratricopeptide (TPR) repeat protein
MSAQTEKAIILLQQGRYAEAEAELRKSFSDSDDPAMTLSYLAIAQLGLNRLKDAENSSAQAIAQDPELAYAYFIRARVLRAATNERDSEKAIRKARSWIRTILLITRNSVSFCWTAARRRPQSKLQIRGCSSIPNLRICGNCERAR